MIDLKIKVDTRAISRSIDDLVRKQLPFATAMAVNDSARQAKEDVRDTMEKVFDRPVSRTLNSVKVKLGTKNRPEARIWIDDEPNKGIAPAKYLRAEILGGPRHHKRFERALLLKGIMPAGTYATPGPAAPLDGNGNIPGSFIVQLLSYLQAFGEQGYRANMTQRRKRSIHKVGRSARGYKTINGKAYFVANGKGNTAHLRPGIYQKSGTHGSNVVPVIMFVASASYSPRLPFASIVAHSVQRNFNAKLSARLDKATATAR